MSDTSAKVRGKRAAGQQHERARMRIGGCSRLPPHRRIYFNIVFRVFDPFGGCGSFFVVHSESVRRIGIVLYTYIALNRCPDTISS